MKNQKKTLQEAAHEYFKRGQLGFEKAADTEEAFLRGGLWQAERMYSEEEVLQLLLRLQQTESYDNLYDWFEQNNIKKIQQAKEIENKLKIKTMYLELEKKEFLKNGQLVLCKCPEWNDEGYQIATWNGEEFEYSGQPNFMFNDLVVSFSLLNEDGEQIQENW